MKEKMHMDMGRIMDDIFEAAENFGNAFKDNINFGPFAHGCHFCWDEKVDHYPLYSYPPSNIFMTKEKNMVFEFALAGFEEKNIQITFQGDFLVFSAKCPEQPNQEEIRYFKRRLKRKDINEQKYYVPEARFDREKTKAVYKNGLLTIIIPPKQDTPKQEGIKVEIVTEEE